MSPTKASDAAETNTANKRSRTVSLKELAAHVGLSPTSLSLVLNNSPKAKSIPQETKDRILAAAAKYNYRPNHLARSLRVQRTHTLGILVSDVSDNYSAVVLNGIEAVLSKRGYLYLLSSHQHQEKMLNAQMQMLMGRQVEGLIAVDSSIKEQPLLPMVNISGHRAITGVTNVTLDHDTAAELGIGHLVKLGHKNIAVIKGQSYSSDTEVRFESIYRAAAALGVEMDPQLTVQLEGDMRSPEVGYVAAKKLLERSKRFTALFSFNDLSAIGAIRAFTDSGLSVPGDISVLGFDDIYGAAFHNPALSTIRQPLFEMGSLAAETLLERLQDDDVSPFKKELLVQPRLIVRESTAIAAKH